MSARWVGGHLLLDAVWQLTRFMNSRSREISRAFYETLGAAGLAARTREDWDATFVRDVMSWLGPPPAHVLDVGCGYGRIAIPLASAGYDVVGLDLSTSLLDAARDSALKSGVDVEWVEASMTEIPLPAATFDACVCLWSAFHELLDFTDQQGALSEMLRVVRSGGRLLIEGGVPTVASADQLESGTRRGVDAREDWTPVAGHENPHFHHDQASWDALFAAVDGARGTVEVRSFGGRPRQVVSIAAF